MHDLTFIRTNPEAFDDASARLALEPASVRILDLDTKHRLVLGKKEALLQRRNEISKEIAIAKVRGNTEEIQSLVDEVITLKEKLPSLEAEEHLLANELDLLLGALPNLPAKDVPDGLDDSANVELRRIGALPVFSFQPQEHYVLGEKLGLMDFDRAAAMSGTRFVILYGALAKLERALTSFMLDSHTRRFGYQEVTVPFLVRSHAAYGTGQLPKFSKDLFVTANNDYWLIPTAEVPLTNLVREQILEEEELPLRFTASSTCFRAEAGAAGRDTRGMIRMHQFTKVELVSIVHPDHSAAEHERMLEAAEMILKDLQLAYRVVVLSTGDMGFSATKTYDIEVWMPGQNCYREISSCSNCGAFQARRMMARFRPKGAKGTRFLHTLNGSGLAVGRTLIAILENYQQADGSVIIPEVLQPYLGGLAVISGGEDIL